MEAVQIVTIKSKIPLFKGNEQANSIELIELEENGFDLISQKDLYQIGDKAIFIQPDYCVSDIPLFDGFIRPQGLESKSYLGKIEGQPRRIRAKKFTFHKGDGVNIYSNGILLRLNEVKNYLDSIKWPLTDLDYTKALGITKYEEPEIKDKNGMNVKGGKAFPLGIYKTDEENINNLWNHIENYIGYPVNFVGTEKIDGSSITIGIKNGEGFICSRNMLKPLTIQKHTGRRNKTLLEKLMFWTKPNLNIFEEIPNDGDDFIKYGKPYLDILLEKNQNNIIFRGELNGGSLKGSGNKNNPASKEQPNIKFFGLDHYVNGKADKMPNSLFEYKCNKFNFPKVKTIFNKTFNSKEELVNECNNYFKNNMIEGIIVRTLNSDFSAKFMNNFYDSLK